MFIKKVSFSNNQEYQQISLNNAHTITIINLNDLKYAISEKRTLYHEYKLSNSDYVVLPEKSQINWASVKPISEIYITNFNMDFPPSTTDIIIIYDNKPVSEDYFIVRDLLGSTYLKNISDKNNDIDNVINTINNTKLEDIKTKLDNINQNSLDILTQLSDLNNLKTFGWFTWFYAFTIPGNATTMTAIQLNDIVNGVVGNVNKSWADTLYSNYYVEIYQCVASISGYSGTATYSHNLGIHNNTTDSILFWLTHIGQIQSTASGTAIRNTVTDTQSNSKSAIPLIMTPNLYFIHYFLNGNGTTNLTVKLGIAGVVKYV